MSGFPRAVAVFLFVLCLVSPASAEEGRTIELPRAGLSLDVPDAWSVEQYGDALLELRHEGTALWVRSYEAGATQKPAALWEADEDGSARFKGLIARGPHIAFEVEAVMEGTAERAAVEAMLDSLDTTPYLHDTRHVDWRSGWTLTLSKGWARSPSALPIADFQAPDGSGRLWVEKLETVWRGADEGEMPADLDAWAAFAWKEGLLRLTRTAGVTSTDAPVIETVEGADGEARRVHLGLDPNDEGKPRGWMHVLVVGGFRVLAYGTGDAGAVKEAVASFRVGTHPGPRVTSDPPSDRFPGEKGPAVVFHLPEGWTLTAGTNSMRVAQFALPSVAGAEGVVFFFGAGKGGGVEQNIERWRGQMKGDDEGTVETLEPAEGVKITVLDVTGAYTTSQMNPHGADPHHDGGDGHGGFRMIAAVVEIAGGPLFVKLIGPDGPIAEHATTVKTWLASFRPAP